MSKGTITGGGEKGLYDVSIERKDGTPLISPAHCADLTEDLSGSVGVLEIAGDLDKGFNIQPGHDGNAAYDPARDGEMKPVQPFPKTSPTGEVYWNWAMRPGWQKWKPNYRYGVISNINMDTDTCDVALDACLATDTPDGKSLDINQSESLTGVTIEYMDCDSGAFSDGDRVIVKFENNDWGSPKVIGFESEPKPCQWEPWGEGLCDNHNWEISYWETSSLWTTDECPSLPFTGTQPENGLYGSFTFSMADGVLTIDQQPQDESFLYTEGSNWFKWAESGEDEGPEVGTLKIDITVTPSVTVANSYLYLHMQDSNGGNAYFFYADSTDITGSGNFDMRNDSGPQEYDLSNYGLSGRIVQVDIYQEAEFPDAITTVIDYLHFA